MPLTLTAKGGTRRRDIAARATLLDALRAHVGLTGTTKGCNHRQCGACPVRPDGWRITACLPLAAMHDWHRITPDQTARRSNGCMRCRPLSSGTTGLRIQDAVPRGESVAVERATAPVAGHVPLGDRRSMAFGGSLVSAGGGRGIVAVTGAARRDSETAPEAHRNAGMPRVLLPATARPAAALWAARGGAMQDGAAGAAFGGSTPRLAVAGFLATAIAFGPARMGFGLFLPEFRDAFALSTTAAGLIASGGFLAFLLALPVAAALDARLGPRVPVLTGAAAAVAGFALVATAPGLAPLAAGVALAGSSAGLCWTPFNDAAERVVPPDMRPGTLSAISTGTTMGVAGAGGLALAVGLGALPWRVTWGLFAIAGVLAAAAAIRAVPGGYRPAPRDDDAPAFLRADTASLYVAALVFGASNAVYLSFAADRVAQAGGLPGPLAASAPATVFLGYGLAGLVGLATGRMEARAGLHPLLAGIFAAFSASLALIGLWPGSWPGVLASAGLQGAAVMTVSATLAIWTLRLFPGRGAQGFTAALIVVGAGSALGPALAGPVIDSLGARAAFLGFAGPAGAVSAGFAAGASGRARRGPAIPGVGNRRGD